MAVAQSPSPDLLASDVAWDLEPLLEGRGTDGVDALLDDAARAASELTRYRGRVAALEADELAELMHEVAFVQERIERVGSYAGLRFAVDTTDAERGRCCSTSRSAPPRSATSCSSSSSSGPRRPTTMSRACSRTSVSTSAATTCARSGGTARTSCPSRRSGSCRRRP